jgi:hypothetical protein
VFVISNSLRLRRFRAVSVRPIDQATATAPPPHAEPAGQREQSVTPHRKGDLG